MKKTCFVIIGFGPKKDHATNRMLDLDKTFENLIKPVFKELKIDCFRAKEIRHTGTIDVPMYEWIYKADIVVADISTLNPNALYELGVRHALRPFSTIVISEKELDPPFDTNHTVIEKYEHLGSDIGVSEARRFKKSLKLKVQAILDAQKNDSPVYTFLPKLIPPKFEEAALTPIVLEKTIDPSFSDLIQDAERAKEKNELKIAAELYKVCLDFEPGNTFLRQRLALVTYKAGKPNPVKALEEAEKILDDLNPETTTDAETLGLSGAINKRLYEINGNLKCLDKALWFYERGYYIQQDYYTGINYAYQLSLKASITDDRMEAYSYFLLANRVRLNVEKWCLGLIADNNFKENPDIEWIYQTLAQVYLAMERREELNQVIDKIQAFSKGAFDLHTFNEQNWKLIEILENFKKKHGA